MTQDLARIRAFMQVYEAGGFSAAARAQGRSKALLSKYVTDLEDHLGVRLMNRSTRKLALTEAGEAYYREVSQVLTQLDEIDAQISEHTGAPRGLLRISAPRNFGETFLAAPLFDFAKTYPDLSLDLRLEDRFVDLIEEGVDVALRIASMPDSSLISRKIAEIGFIAVAAPDFLDRHGRPTTPDELAGLACIVDSNQKSPGNWRFVMGDKSTNVQVAGPVRVNSPLAAAEAAASGLGVALTAAFLAEPMIRDGRLERILACETRQTLPIHVVYPSRRHLAGKVRALIDHLVSWFEKNPI